MNILYFINKILIELHDMNTDFMNNLTENTYKRRCKRLL